MSGTVAVNVNGIIGPGMYDRSQTPQLALGTALISDTNQTFVYVQASVALAAAAPCTVSQTTFLATAGSGYTVDVNPFAIGDYGFVRKTTSPL